MHPFMRLGIEEGMEKGLEQGLQKGLQKGLEQGLEQGLRKGLQKGLEQGLQQGLEQGLLLLLRIFERRLGRPVTDRERRRIAKRMDKDGPELLGDVVIDLSPEQLAAWLAPRKPSKRAE